MRLPNDNMTKRPSGYIVEIRNPIRRRTTPHIWIVAPELPMPAAVIENPSNIARNVKSDLNNRSSDLRLRCNHMRKSESDLMQSSEGKGTSRTQVRRVIFWQVAPAKR